MYIVTEGQNNGLLGVFSKKKDADSFACQAIMLIEWDKDEEPAPRRNAEIVVVYEGHYVYVDKVEQVSLLDVEMNSKEEEDSDIAILKMGDIRLLTSVSSVEKIIGELP